MFKRDLDNCIERTGEINCPCDTDKLIEDLSDMLTESESADAKSNKSAQ